MGKRKGGLEGLRELRRERGLSQAELSEKTGIAQSTISLLESGERDPRGSTLRTLAEFLGVGVGELYEVRRDPLEQAPEPVLRWVQRTTPDERRKTLVGLWGTPADKGAGQRGTSGWLPLSQFPEDTSDNALEADRTARELNLDPEALLFLIVDLDPAGAVRLLVAEQRQAEAEEEALRGYKILLDYALDKGDISIKEYPRRLSGFERELAAR
jgi:transcriptional regulator with XRE-family HTH domain